MKIKIEKPYDLDTPEINLEGGYSYTEDRIINGKKSIEVNFSQFTMILEPEFENEMKDFLLGLNSHLKDFEESEDTNTK